MQYQEMTIEVSELARSRQHGRAVVRFKVRVLESPVGQMRPEEAIPVQYDERELQAGLRRLEQRDLDRAQMAALGRSLALLLLPPGKPGSAMGVRQMFTSSLMTIGPDSGLRLRLRLPREIAALPWEYLYLDRAGGGNGMDGFLALDPRVAMVRQELLAAPAPMLAIGGTIRMVAAFAAHPDLPELDLEQEIGHLQEALIGHTGIRPIFLENATLADVQSATQGGAAIFHFAGHGAFDRRTSDAPGTYSGTGMLAFDDGFVDAEQLGIILRGNGVRLAVLAGCETGRRDGVNVWSGIAPALVKAEVPAVVANQFSIRDDCAIAFSQQFYRALIGGLPVERAVTAGRIAAYNVDREGRDWGVPVLYLQSRDGQLFAGADDPAVREEARKSAEADVVVQAKRVEAGGQVLAAEVGEILAGELGVSVSVADTVFGRVTGLDAKQVAGGKARVDVRVGTVGQGGKVEGAKINRLG